MLKGISPILSPELLKILMEMGHGDELVVADGNFPGTSVGQRCVRLDGHGGAEVMRAIINLFPLDDFVEKPMAVMEVPAGMFSEDRAPIWAEYEAIGKTDMPKAAFEFMEHEAFIDRARRAYVVVQTGESALYANVILRKGVVRG